MNMDDKLYKILKKVYDKKRYVKDENGYQRPIKTGDVFDSATKTFNYSIEILTDAEKEYLFKSGYPVNEVVGYSHDECIHLYKQLLDHPNLNMDNLIAAYICGFSSFPRGRQPILSFLFARAVPEHSFVELPGYSHCNFCIVNKQEWVQRGYEIFRKYWGYSWTEFWADFLSDCRNLRSFHPAFLPRRISESSEN